MDALQVKQPSLVRSALFVITLTWFSLANAAPLTLVVDSTGDFIDKTPGNGICADILNECTLRAAITEANLNPGADSINFAIAGSAPFVIDILGTALPPVTGDLVINGTSQPGFVGGPASSPVIEITSGPAAKDGLVIDSGIVSIFSIAITNMKGHGLVAHADGLLVDGCYLGVSTNGIAAGNNLSGIKIDGKFARIGAARGNVISANGESGVVVLTAGTTDNVISGNYIGVNVTGTAAMPNLRNGIELIFGSSGTTVGGANAGNRNIISGNALNGIEIGLNPSDFSDGNHILGNYIGTDVSGNSAIGNGRGIIVNGGIDNIIGSDGFVFTGNTISGNVSDGVFLGTGNTIVAFNHIGTNAAATAAIGNGDSGISINGDGNQVGQANVISGNLGIGIDVMGDNNGIALNIIGTSLDFVTPLANNSGVLISGSNNEVSSNGIAGNTGVGIRVSTGTGNLLARNLMFGNGSIPVDLGNDLETGNDPGDADSGPNLKQNSPMISTVKYSQLSDQLAISFRIDSHPDNVTYPLSTDVFITDDNHVQPRYFLGTLDYSSTDFSTGIVTMVINNPPRTINPGDFIIMQAKDAADNSSEFSYVAAITLFEPDELIFQDSFETAP